jgi:hypothetical protein
MRDIGLGRVQKFTSVKTPFLYNEMPAAVFPKVAWHLLLLLLIMILILIFRREHDHDHEQDQDQEQELLLSPPMAMREPYSFGRCGEACPRTLISGLGNGVE